MVRGRGDLRQRQAAARADPQRPLDEQRARRWRSGCGPCAGWLESQTSPQGHFRPIGCNGFYRRGEAAGRLRPAADRGPGHGFRLHRGVSRHRRFLAGSSEARSAFEWFLGRNDLGLELYDAATGGCRDGLHVDRVSQNQGAESTLAFLLALAEMKLLESSLAAFRLRRRDGRRWTGIRGDEQMKTVPRRILARCLLRPTDVQPRFERFEVIGTFNPAAKGLIHFLSASCSRIA